MLTQCRPDRLDGGIPLRRSARTPWRVTSGLPGMVVAAHAIASILAIPKIGFPALVENLAAVAVRSAGVPAETSHAIASGVSAETSAAVGMPGEPVLREPGWRTGSPRPARACRVRPTA